MTPRPRVVRIVGSPLVVLAAVTSFVIAFTGTLLDLAGLSARVIAGGILVGMLTIILSVVLGFAGTGALGMKKWAWGLAFLAASGIIAGSLWGINQPGPASIGAILTLAFTGLVALYLPVAWKQFARPAIDAENVSETNPLKLNPTRLVVVEFYVMWIVLWILSALAFLDPTNAIVDWRLFGFRVQSFVGAFLGLLGVVAFVIAEVSRITTAYTITDLRVFRREGIIRRRIDEMPLSKVERIELNQGVLQRVFGYGTIELDSGEENRERLKLESLERPKFLREMLSKLVRRSTAGRGYAASQPAAVISPATAYGSRPIIRASQVKGVPTSSPFPPPLRQPPVNPPARSGWEAADAEVQNLERQVREDREFLLRLDTSLLDGRIDNATYSEEKQSRTDHIAKLERRITEQRDERKPHL